MKNRKATEYAKKFDSNGLLKDLQNVELMEGFGELDYYDKNKIKRATFYFNGGNCVRAVEYIPMQKSIFKKSVPFWGEYENKRDKNRA